MGFSRGSSPPREWTWVAWTTGRFFTTWDTQTSLWPVCGSLLGRVSSGRLNDLGCSPCPFVNNKSCHLLSLYNVPNTMSEASCELSPLSLTFTPCKVGAIIVVCFPEAEATWLLAEGAECGVQLSERVPHRSTLLLPRVPRLQGTQMREKPDSLQWIRDLWLAGRRGLQSHCASRADGAVYLEMWGLPSSQGHSITAHHKVGTYQT